MPCHSSGLSATVERTIADIKLAGETLYYTEFKPFSELTMLCWLIIESFIGHMGKDKPVYNIQINHPITLILEKIMVHYLLQELRSRHLFTTNHLNLIRFCIKRDKNRKLIISTDIRGHVNLSDITMQRFLVQSNKPLIQVTWNGRGRFLYINKFNGNITKKGLKRG